MNGYECADYDGGHWEDRLEQQDRIAAKRHELDLLDPDGTRPEPETAEDERRPTSAPAPAALPPWLPPRAPPTTRRTRPS